MACCHGLATVNGDLIGDPLEVKMFEATGAKLDDLNGVIQKLDEIMKGVK